MKEKEPWERPDIEERGSRNEDEIYLAVGRALSKWELVENEFIELYALFIGCKNIHQSYLKFFPALRAYGSQISFSSRIEMVAAAGNAYFFLLKGEEKKKAESAEAEFPKFLARCRNYSTLRNDIAHGMAQIRVDRGENGKLEQFKGNYLFPGLFASRKYPLGQRVMFAYTAVQIEKMAEQFEELSRDVSVFKSDIEHGPWPWPPESPPAKPTR
jgi:hypothetical protein